MRRYFLTTSLIVWLVACASVAAAETYYKWVDEYGIVHVTNVISEVPKDIHVEVFKFTTKQPEGSLSHSPDQKPTSPEKNLRASEPASGLESAPPPPEPLRLTPAQQARQALMDQLNKARQAERAFQQSEYKWLSPEEINLYITEYDLHRMPRYGYDRGAPLIRRLEAIYYMRNKVKELESKLAR